MKKIENRLQALEQRQQDSKPIVAVILGKGKPAEQVDREVAALRRHYSGLIVIIDR